MIRNYFVVLSIIVLLVSVMILPFLTWGIVALICALITVTLSYYIENLEKKALIKTIETQRETAQDSIV